MAYYTNPLADAQGIDVAVSDVPVEEPVRVVSSDDGEERNG